ncbi:MAG: hypothetical protein ACRCTZ_02945 [Sarcina sp.]
MKTFNEKREMAKEAIELIKEFNEVQESIKDSLMSDFVIIENEEEGIILITYNDEVNFEEGEFFLSEIHKVFEDDMDGFGPCGAFFYEAIAEAKDDAESTYGEVSKEEYIQNVGKVSYIEKRSEEIYDRLKKISKLCK